MKDVIERLTKLSKVGFGYDIKPEDREALQAAVAALSASPAGVVKPQYIGLKGASEIASADLASMSAIEPAGVGVETRTFKIRDMVRKHSGSWWEGRVVGFYSTEQTPDGVCVQLDKPMGPVQIYPAAALTKEGTHD